MSPVEREFIPARRTADLVVRTQFDETLVLDTRNDRVHCLPGEVALVWEACDGARTAADLAALTGADPAAIDNALAQLADLDLLEAAPAGVDRRRFLRRTAIVGGSVVALPLIQTVLAPAAFAGCSTTNIQLVQGGQDSCTGNAAHAKYTITLQGCDANTSYFPLLSYTSDTGPTVEVGKTLTTDATGFATSGPGASVTNSKIKNGSTTMTLTLYFDKNHTQPVPGGTVNALFTITC